MSAQSKQLPARTTIVSSIAFYLVVAMAWASVRDRVLFAAIGLVLVAGSGHYASKSYSTP